MPEEPQSAGVSGEFPVELTTKYPATENDPVPAEKPPTEETPEAEGDALGELDPGARPAEERPAIPDPGVGDVVLWWASKGAPHLHPQPAVVTNRLDGDGKLNLRILIDGHNPGVPANTFQPEEFRGGTAFRGEVPFDTLARVGAAYWTVPST